MTIGTDTFPSDFIQEMRYAACLGKVVERTTFAVSARDIFYAATVNGAKALGRNDLGRLEKGCKADFVVFQLNSIEMSPVRDVVKNIIYSATPTFSGSGVRCWQVCRARWKSIGGR